MNLSKPDSHKSPGATVVKIILCTFLFSICVVALSGQALAALDKWMDNLVHQVYTAVALILIIAGGFVFWTIKRWR